MGDEAVERLLFTRDGESICGAGGHSLLQQADADGAFNCGHTDTGSIEEYIARGGYQAVAEGVV